MPTKTMFPDARFSGDVLEIVMSRIVAEMRCVDHSGKTKARVTGLLF
jgi:hypothetical protein